MITMRRPRIATERAEFEADAVTHEPLLGLRVAPHDGGRPYVAYPSRRNARWLLPVDTLLSRAGISLYAPTRVRGRALKALIASGWLRGHRVALEEGPLAQLEAHLGRILGAPEVRLAFSIGTPGAYRKVTAQAMTPGGAVLAYAKLANRPPARAALEAERRTLLRLAAVGLLRNRIPEVIGRFDWRDCDVLLITAGPARPGPGRLSEAHLAVLRLLHNAFTEAYAFTDSPMWVRMVDAVDRLRPGLPDPWPARYGRALGCLQARVGRTRVPVSLAHRDFAPWNTRWGPHGLFVFDWESAADGVTPLYDAFNFEALQAALGRRTYRPPFGFLRGWLTALWPQGAAYIDGLYLAYLMDLSLFYRESALLAPHDNDERVWRWLGRQIDACVEGRNGMA